jgi:hypothetical protein
MIPDEIHVAAAAAADAVATEQAGALAGNLTPQSEPATGATGWMRELAQPFGPFKPTNYSKRELAQVAEMVAAMERELEEPVLVVDRMRLASIARHWLQESRAFRLSSRGIERPGGDVRPVSLEHRAYAKGREEMVERLRFKRTPPGTRSLEQILAEARAPHSGAAAVTTDRPTATEQAHDVEDGGGL